MTKASHVIHGEVDLADGIYYKLLWTHNNHRNCHAVTVVCMQWFDEHDYDASKFVKTTEGDVHVFATEELAKIKLNEWFNKEEIDPDYVLFSVPSTPVELSQREIGILIRWYAFVYHESLNSFEDDELLRKLEASLEEESPRLTIR